MNKTIKKILDDFEKGEGWQMRWGMFNGYVYMKGNITITLEEPSILIDGSELELDYQEHHSLMRAISNVDTQEREEKQQDLLNRVKL
jgi:hypothetical protein